MDDIIVRIKKDIALFEASMKKAGALELSADEARIVSLANDYASDSVSWLEKNDYYTSFSSIAYAHGMMDALLRLRHVIE